MEDLLIDTGLIGDNKVLLDYLEANNIKTLEDFYNIDIDMIEDIYIKNLLRGLKDLIQYKYYFLSAKFFIYTDIYHSLLIWMIKNEFQC